MFTQAEVKDLSARLIVKRLCEVNCHDHDEDRMTIVVREVLDSIYKTPE